MPGDTSQPGSPQGDPQQEEGGQIKKAFDSIGDAFKKAGEARHEEVKKRIEAVLAGKELKEGDTKFIDQYKQEYLRGGGEDFWSEKDKPDGGEVEKGRVENDQGGAVLADIIDKEADQRNPSLRTPEEVERGPETTEDFLADIIDAENKGSAEGDTDKINPDPDRNQVFTRDEVAARDDNEALDGLEEPPQEFDSLIADIIDQENIRRGAGESTPEFMARLGDLFARAMTGLEGQGEVNAEIMLKALVNHLADEDPAIAELRDQDPEAFEKMRVDLFDVVKERDPEARRAKIAEVIQKYEVLGQWGEKISPILEFAAKMYGLVGDRKVTEEDRKGLKEKISGKINWKEWGGAIGVIGFTILLTIVILAMLEMKLINKMIGKKGSK